MPNLHLQSLQRRIKIKMANFSFQGLFRWGEFWERETGARTTGITSNREQQTGFKLSSSLVEWSISSLFEVSSTRTNKYLINLGITKLNLPPRPPPLAPSHSPHFQGSYSCMAEEPPRGSYTIKCMCMYVTLQTGNKGSIGKTTPKESLYGSLWTINA